MSTLMVKEELQLHEEIKEITLDARKRLNLTVRPFAPGRFYEKLKVTLQNNEDTVEEETYVKEKESDE